MSAQIQLGLYIDGNKLSFVETINTVPSKFFQIDLPGEGQTFISKDSTIAEAIKQNLTKYNISTSNVNLTLPTKDIIFRSFVIPWMQSSEIKGVVDFEASKYVPFSLEELSYSYHPMTFSSDGTKRIRIIFVAIKKETLDYYNSILTQAGLEVNIVEPAPLSLIRTLTLKEKIPQDQTIAIIERSKASSAKITIIDQGVPQFVREFSLKVVAHDQKEENDENTIYARLINEIRISLDYFNRQDTLLNVTQLIYLESSETEDSAKKLEHDLAMPVQIVKISEIFRNDSMRDPGLLIAYGVTIISSIGSVADFNLSGKKIKSIRTSSSKGKKGLPYKLAVCVIILCFSIVGATHYFLKKRSLQPNSELDQLTSKISSFKNQQTADLQQKTKSMEQDIKVFQTIRLDSNIHKFLQLIPDLLPEGVWLTSMQIEYINPPDPPAKSAPAQKKGKKDKTTSAVSEDVKTKMIIHLQGYAYLEEIKEQFGLVTNFLNNLGKNEDFKNNFTHIDLETVSTKTLGEYTVTYFSIKCTD